MKQQNEFGLTIDKKTGNSHFDTRCRICQKKLMTVIRPYGLSVNRKLLWSKKTFYFIISHILPANPTNPIQRITGKDIRKSSLCSEACFCTEKHAKAFLFNYLLKK